MIPQTDRRCKPFLGKKRPGREKAHGVSSRPGVRTARPMQTPSGKLSAVVWAAGAGFMQGRRMCRGRFCGEPRRGAAAGGGRVQPAGARAAGPLRGVGAGALWWGRMVRGGRPAGAPAEGRGRGRPGAAPTPPQAAARRAVGAGEMLGRGRGGCGGAGRGPAGARPQGGPRPGEARPPAPQAPDCGATRPRQKGEWL